MVAVQSFPESYFERQDVRDDAAFYRVPRKVVHVDEGAIRRVTAHIEDLMPQGGAYLDLMSSWRSHLPHTLHAHQVIGLGMNAEEMRDNPQLDDYTVQNLNTNPVLPYPDAIFDGAMCTVSVQYMTRPVDVFHEVGRVLKPGAPFLVTFSNRCFPTKAVAVWLGTSDQQHLALVAKYFEAAGNWADIHADQYIPGHGDPLYAVWAYRS